MSSLKAPPFPTELEDNVDSDMYVDEPKPTVERSKKRSDKKSAEEKENDEFIKYLQGATQQFPDLDIEKPDPKPKKQPAKAPNRDSKMTKELFRLVLQSYEAALGLAEIDIEGLAEEMINNPIACTYFSSVLDMYNIEGFMDPRIGLLFILASTTYSCYAKNKQKNMIAASGVRSFEMTRAEFDALPEYNSGQIGRFTAEPDAMRNQVGPQISFTQQDKLT